MTNFINKLTVWQKDLIILAILNASILSRIIGLSDIAGVFFLAIFPGILIQRLLAYKAEYAWERIVHTIALSISFVMFSGLAVNALLPVLNISRPLAQLPILISFDILLGVLITTNAFLRREMRVFYSEVSLISAVGQVLSHLWLFVLPILAIAGATILNNGGSNIVTGVAIFIAAIFLLYAVSSECPKREYLIITGLYCVSLALLFASSMRSWHVIGWDVNAELQVFRVTKDAMHWSMSYMQDAYNACLSITLLPTIFSSFVHISDEYIYKFLFQFIFAFMPISIFYLVRNFTNVRIAVLAATLLVGNVFFSHGIGMPALIRQEFGFLYFGLVLLVIFSPNMNARMRLTLAIIYGFSIIVSHYSTTYITIFLLTLAMSLNLGLHVAKKVFPRMLLGHVSHAINIWYVIILIIGTITWSSVITGTSNNLTSFLDYSGSNIEKSFSYDTWSRAISQIMIPYPHYEGLNKYISQETINFRQLHPDMTFYGDKQVNIEVLVSKTFARSPSLLGQSAKKIADKVFQALKLVLNNLFIVLGTVVLIYQWYIRKFKSSEFIFLSLGGFITLGLLLLLPDALARYNVDRLYFQLLMIWALSSATAGFITLSFMSTRMRFAILGILYCMLMLFYSSLVFSITGGTALVSINNFGADYDKFYVHDSEVFAARWLGKRGGKTSIFADSAGYLRLRSHGNVDQRQIFMTILPSVIDKNSYVFLTHMNVVTGVSTYLFYNEEYAYTAPINFLNKNKNAIYDNGTSKIFR